MKFDLSNISTHDTGILEDAIQLKQSVQEVSVEGLSALWRGAGDLAHRLFNNCKNIFLHGFQGLKRSELREYLESHATTFKALRTLPEAVMEKELFFIPAEMRCTYTEAAEYLDGLYQFVAPAYNTRRGDWLRSSEAELIQLKKAVNVGKPINATEGGHILPNHDQLDKALDQKGELLGRMFIGSKGRLVGPQLLDAVSIYARRVFDQGELTKTGAIKLVDKDTSNQTLEMVKFKTLFRDLTDMHRTLNMYIGMENRLVQIARVNTGSERISGLLDDIMALSPTSSLLTRNVLEVLATDIAMLAKLLHLYGYAAAVQLTVEHNLVRSLTRLSERLLD